MTKDEKLIIASGVTAGVLIALTVNKITADISYRRRMKKINAETTAEIARIKKAGKKVSAMINAGKYDGTNTIAQIFEDFEFERIIADI